ncbi:hypothetical protein [Azospirillum argentinense]|uniref:Uncharacterized protein n=1 Tax=Azospirillum argentinense TaxID=2970906 RepID=A0A5B0KUB3_9PROT|nr:hypothetical protein [Azospirillum argentinense]KAA1054454.1 hypothetical protein FH063_006710 [Azospirillum argentinense]
MDHDDLLRSAVATSMRAKRALDDLQDQSPDDLYRSLAAQVAAASSEAPSSASFVPTGQAQISDDDLRRGPQADDLRRGQDIELGKRIFQRWNRTLHEFVCKPNTADQDLRAKLVGALTGTEGGGVALVAGILVAAFGASPAVAAIVAALLIKLVVAPAADEICQVWAAALPTADAPGGHP